MSSLTAMEKRVLERLFDMGGGYVLNFSNRTIHEFVMDTVALDIYDKKYDSGSGSKANRLRAFWSKESDHTVARLLSAMVELSVTELDPDPDLLEKARGVVRRLESAASVDDLDSIAPNLLEKDFETLARTVHDSINAGEPQVGLDRLHTFVSRYIDVLAEREGIKTSRDKPLHSTFGEVVRALRARGVIETEMAERILKSTISTFESFSHVRNDRTFAHPNPLLSFDEALLIFRHVTSAIRFLKTISETIENNKNQDSAGVGDDLPF